ncbi:MULTISPECIES: signal recognition particle-docking protein FtsY [unclassified Corynebacterium]|uniref:signal recognition particle-docking protein FtsY n=1 Tax=unclassified Corynebacterium TaxID=2624378 RepID=UPI002652D4C2|nr:MULTISPECIES: signal recognition particle-docking protein FtsY [unclassified Corynebacterium]MDN8593683.1 signal recognition particle-docking protein FtsY [Corynebacterium sp. P4_F2]WKK56654.1 signal recognition particle-docking protein FtsY [Corynebacterium sp. P4-C1]WKK64434.1 signal recognition particle-docking protein FtsY [Corynebacterium sp. P8-C1]
MNSTALWVTIAVVVALLIILGIIIVVGKNRKKSKTVSFEKKEPEQQKELTQQEKSGNYQAKGGFNFAPAGAPTAEKEPVRVDEPLKRDTPSTSAKAAGAGAAAAGAAGAAAASAAKPADASDSSDVSDTTGTTEMEQIAPAPTAADEVDPVELGETETEVIEPDPAEIEPAKDPAPEAQVDQGKAAPPAKPETPAEPTGKPGGIAGADHLVEPEVAADDSRAEAEAEAEAKEAAEAARTTADAAEEAREQTPAPKPDAAAGTTGAAGAAAAGAGAAAAGTAEANEAAEETQASVIETEPVPDEQLDDIEPAAGRIGKLRGRLSRSQNAIGQGLLGILSAGDLDEDAWEEIEDTLIMADLGAELTMKVTESLREKIAERGVSSEEEARAMLRETLIEAGKPELDRSIKAMPNNGKPAVILVVGVNGTGKTTTTGKLARVLISMGHSVVLGAADTFRAAAADQLETWGRRVGASTVRGKEGADPASVAFDAVKTGVEQQADVVLVDTAGRLHTSTGLMDQLGKVKRVVEKKSQVDEVLLVLDATVGQNGLTQARVFKDVVEITGVVLTKLDGTAKGGIVFQVQEELGVPVKLVGLGEGADDLAPFEVEGFVDALLG